MQKAAHASNATVFDRLSRVEIVYALVLAILALSISELPYLEADRTAKPGHRFIGYYFPASDIGSYFSFIQQAADGSILFKNNLTYLPSERIFLQPVWVVLGFVIHAMDLSTRVGFALWRILGALVLMLGFATLASVVVPLRSHRIMALTLCAFGGGGGWLLWVLSKVGLLDISGEYYLQNPAIDLGAPIHAFAHIAKNPHYSLPHGTYLFFWYFYLKAEQGDRRWVYCGAACALAILQGFIRQYDLIGLFAIIPLFIAAESYCKRRFDSQRALMQTFPMLAAAPVLAYQVYLFSFHPVFSASATQGGQPYVPLHWHLLSLGIMLFLIPWRLYFKPLQSPSELLLLLWAIVLFGLFHINALSAALSFSPQVAMSLMSPLILLAVGSLPRVRIGNSVSRRSVTINALVIVFGCLTTPFYVERAVEDIHKNEAILYLSEDDFAAIGWLRERTNPHSVILSSYHQSNKLSAQLNRQFAIGHWGFSPNCKLLSKICDGILSAKFTPTTTLSLLAEYNVDLIYVPTEYAAAAVPYLENMPGIKLLFRSGDVHIFSVEKNQRR